MTTGGPGRRTQRLHPLQRAPPNAATRHLQRHETILVLVLDVAKSFSPPLRGCARAPRSDSDNKPSCCLHASHGTCGGARRVARLSQRHGDLPLHLRRDGYQRIRRRAERRVARAAVQQHATCGRTRRFHVVA